MTMNYPTVSLSPGLTFVATILVPTMARLILFLLLLFPAISNAQYYLTKTRGQVKKELGKYLEKYDSLSGTISETDSSVQLSIKQGSSQPADFIYLFNKAGKCRVEKVISYCDSCHTKFLKHVLDNKKYGWKKINGNQYVSAYRYRMMLELPPEGNETYYMILHTDWSKDLYKLLTER
jgi:hypothetical protein